MFCGAISSFVLIPRNGPINFTKWLNGKKQGRRRAYMTGALYGEFLREKVIPAVQEVVGEDLSDVIWQDDQDGKHRVKVVMDTIKEFFEERIEPEVGDAKLADVWPIENIWGMLKEKTRGIEFTNENALIRRINQECRTITIKPCQHMMDEIPK